MPNASLTPSRYSLFAANKANLDVLGDAVISFAIDGHKFKADVSKKVDEFLLGSEWLEKHVAKWDFAGGAVALGDRLITVHHRHRAGICRRVLVAKDCDIPAKHETNVSVWLVDEGIPSHRAIGQLNPKV